MANVLVVGDAILDFVFADIDRYPDLGEEIIAPQYELRPAGSAGYASTGLAALGADVSVSTVVGDDLLSGHWIDFVGSYGVDTSHVTRLEDERVSAAAAFLFPEERSFVTYRGASDTDTIALPSPGDYDAVLVTGFSQAPYLWDRELVAFCETADRLDIPVYVDTNWSEGEWHPYLESIYPYTEYLLVNRQEVRRLTGTTSIEDGGKELLDAGVSCCVIKADADGCYLVTKEETTHVPTGELDVVDACGAGDFFNAGFISARADGRPITEAAQVGNDCAGTAVTTFELRAKLDGIATD